MSKTQIIKLKGLHKKFTTEEVETLALNNINLSIDQGEFVAVMGPSGCGKSTLLNVLGLLDNPNEGSFLFDDTEVSELKEKERTKVRKGNVGFVFQSFNLIDELTVFENVEVPLKYLGFNAKDRKAKVNAALDRMKMGHRSQHFPQQLSGGQQQRVALCRAVVANPKLVLADEPTGNLDSKNGEEVMQLLLELNRSGTTIVMVTHSDYDASFAHRIIQLFDGKLITEEQRKAMKENQEPLKP